MNIKINRHFLLYKGYKLKCAVGKSGINSAKKEGDLSTPKGTYKIGILYYRKEKIKNLKCKIRKKIIKKNMGWCDDINSSKYNKEITFPFRHRAEKLYRKDSKYDLLLDIRYNTSPVVKGKGSAIFLHLSNKKYKPTKGCVAIIKKDFLKILPLINKNTKVLIS
tara:strand:- start:2099 stop:2590 length:492 start_codon:yes stop_codon:yes gene_type:complete